MDRRPTHVRATGRARVALAIAMLVALVAGFVAAAPAFAGSRPTATSAKVVSSTNPNSISLTSPGAVVVQSITITKGTWTLIAKASLINPGAAGDFFRCELVDTTHSIVIDGSTTFLNPAEQYDVVTNLALFTVSSRATISQECGHDGTAGDSGFVDFSSSLVGFVAPPARVLAAVTHAQTPLTTSGNVDALHLALPAGTWIVIAKVTPVVLSAASVEVTCSDDSVSGGAQRNLGTGPGLHAASTIFKAGAVVTLKKRGKVHLLCGAAGSGAYIDPGAVLWAWKASSAQAVATSPCPLTATAKAATDALVLRQTGPCAIAAGTRSSAMAHAKLPAGTWIALGGVFDLASTSANVVACELYDPAKAAILDIAEASESSVAGFPTTGTTNLFVVNAKRARAIDADCGEDMTGAAGTSTGASWVFLRP